MRRLDVALAVACAALLAAGYSTWGSIATADAGPGRHGKVVRVERPKAIVSDQIQLCGPDTTDSSADTPTLMCFGNAPRNGAIIEFIDEAGYRGRGRVVRTKPGLSMFDRCEQKSGHTVYYEWISRPADHRGTNSGANLAGVIGVKVSHLKARLMSSPERRPPDGEAGSVAIGLDADGDNAADLVVLWRECRDKAPASAAGRSGAVICLDYWVYSRATWRLVNQAVIYSCF